MNILLYDIVNILVEYITKHLPIHEDCDLVNIPISLVSCSSCGRIIAVNPKANPVCKLVVATDKQAKN